MPKLDPDELDALIFFISGHQFYNKISLHTAVEKLYDFWLDEAPKDYLPEGIVR